MGQLHDQTTCCSTGNSGFCPLASAERLWSEIEAAPGEKVDSIRAIVADLVVTGRECRSGECPQSERWDRLWAGVSASGVAPSRRRDVFVVR